MLKSAKRYTGLGKIQAHLSKPTKEESDTNLDSESDNKQLMATDSDLGSDVQDQSSEEEVEAEVEESDEGQHQD